MMSGINNGRKRKLVASGLSAGLSDDLMINTKSKPSAKLTSRTKEAIKNAATASLSASDRVDRWKFVATRRPAASSSLQHRQQTPLASSLSNDEPFSVDDLMMQSNASKVESVIVNGISQWKDLDLRRVHLNENDTNNKPAKRRLGWVEPKFILPDNFDYKSTRGPPNFRSQIEQQNPYPRDMVVSLAGNVAGEMQDYETELWHIFDTIPTEQQLSAVDTVDDDIDTIRLLPACKGRLQTQLLKDEIEQGLKKHSGLDGHSLSRLRVRGMHHFPTCINLEQHNKVGETAAHHNASSTYTMARNDTRATSATTSETTRNASINNNIDDYSVIIRIECWKRNLKRGSSVDGNKLELEFYGNHTLLDLHKAIQRHTKDPFEGFFRQQQQQQQQRIVLSEPSTTTTTTTTVTTPSTIEKNHHDSSTTNSGIFFIENVLYSTGPVDYCMPIIKWLAGDDSSNQSSLFWPRDTFLGLTSSMEQTNALQIKDMCDVHLKDIPIRLGVRYFHAFNGDLQTSIFFSDVSCCPATMCIRSATHLNKDVTEIDNWSFFTDDATSTCQGCSHCIPVVVCVDDELTDGSPKVLCASCYHKLHYTSEGGLRYNNFRVFPIELVHTRLLSVRNEHKDFLF